MNSFEWNGKDIEGLLAFCGAEAEVKCRFGTQDYKVSVQTKFGSERVYVGDTVMKSDINGLIVKHTEKSLVDRSAE